MKLELKTHQEPQLRALRVQLIPIQNGVLIKGVRVKMKIEGGRAAEVIQTTRGLAAEDKGRDAFCDHFAAPERAVVERWVRQREARRFLLPADKAPEPAGE